MFHPTPPRQKSGVQGTADPWHLTGGYADIQTARGHFRMESAEVEARLREGGPQPRRSKRSDTHPPIFNTQTYCTSIGLARRELLVIYNIGSKASATEAAVERLFSTEANVMTASEIA